MNKNLIKVGIMGFGVVGKKRFQILQESPHFEVVAISDKRLRLKEFNSESKKLITNENIKLYDDYLQLYELEIDVLFVSLPNNLAANATIKGLKRGCHVFCEKPPGRDVDDIKNVIEVEKNCLNVKLKYGFNHRYHGSVEEAKRIIDSKEFGEVLIFRGLYGKSRVVPFSGGWRCQRNISGGGILLDQGIHMLDIMRYFCGDFYEIKSFVSNEYWNHDVEDNVFAVLKDAKGRYGTVHSSATQWAHTFRLEIALEQGFLELTGILSGSKSYGEEKLKVISRKDYSAIGSQTETVIKYLEDNSWKKEIDEFADIIMNNTKVKNGNSIDALNVMKMVYRIYFADEKWRSKYNIKNPDS